MIRFFKPKIFLYIFGELLSPYVLSLFVLLLTILMVQMFRFTDIILIYGSDLDSIILLLKSLLISTFPIIIPLAFLSAILLGYGRMSQDSELVAFSSLGYSKRQLLLPSLFLCLLSFIFCFFCVTDLGPKGVKTSKILSTQIAGETLAANLKPGVFLTVGQMTVYVESLDKKTKDFKNLFILDQKNKQAAVVFSKSGEMITQENQGSYLKMENGQIHYNLKEANHAVIDFQEYDFMTDAESKKNSQLPLKALTNTEIFEARSKLNAQLNKQPTQNSSRTDFDYRLEIHKRYQLSFVSLVFLVLGVAFGFNIFQRVSKSESLGICIFMAMAYWILYFIFESLAGNAKVLIYLYVPNFLFLFIAIVWMIYKNDTFSDMFRFRR